VTLEGTATQDIFLRPAPAPSDDLNPGSDEGEAWTQSVGFIVPVVLLGVIVGILVLW
jgi:hypothetical protein